MTLTGTAPILSLQIPLILLGRKGLGQNLDSGPERHMQRLGIMEKVLRELCPEIAIKVWLSNFLHKDVQEKSTRGAEGRKKRYEAWLEAEKERWKTFEGSGAWVLRLTVEDASDGLGFGMFEGRRQGDGWLTPSELRVKGEAVWTCAFLLQRFGVSVANWVLFEKEAKRVLGVLESFSTFVPPQSGRMFAIVKGERCWPSLRFCSDYMHLDGIGNQDRSWGLKTTTNLLTLLTAFEREFLVLSTPSFLLAHAPVSHFLMLRKVRMLEKKRKDLWRRVRDSESGGVSVGERRKTKTWEREVGKWVEEMKWEDEKKGGLEMMLGDQGRGWWVDIIEEDGEVERDLERWLKEGGRVVVGLYADEGEGRHTAFDDTDTVKTTAMSNFDSSAPPSPLTPTFPPPLGPCIRHLIFHIPLTSSTLHSTPLLAYIKLLAQTVSFAQESTVEKVKTTVHEFRKISESPWTGLERIAKMLGLGRECVRAWEGEVGRYWNGGAETVVEGSWGFEDMLRKGMEELNKYGAGTDERDVGGAGSEKVDHFADPFSPFLKYVGRSLDRERAYMPQVIERYERVGGFLVPSQTNVYTLMMANEERRQEKEMNREEGQEDERGRTRSRLN